MPPLEHPKSNGVAVAYLREGGSHASEHERAVLMGVVQRLADLLGYRFEGVLDPARSYPAHVYFVPNTTLDAEQALRLGIRGTGDLFGGVVPHTFIGSKAITHPLIAKDATAPEGWNAAFALHAGDSVLPGFTAFSRQDAQEAGLRLLEQGRVRLKRVNETGGHGQSVASNASELDAQLQQIDAAQLRDEGLVLEQDLADVQTFSVGQVSVAELTASYFGAQRLTRNNRGQEVFGGSDLTLVRGGFDELEALAPQPPIARAVEQACRYDTAVRSCYPGFFASRSNYDVVFGRDEDGRWRSGVLEQSWRVGGATGAEVAALQLFRAQPQRTQVRASTVEIYGDSPEPPSHATVYFRGTDPRAGRLTKYTLVHDGDTR